MFLSTDRKNNSPPSFSLALDSQSTPVLAKAFPIILRKKKEEEEDKIEDGAAAHKSDYSNELYIS